MDVSKRVFPTDLGNFHGWGGQGKEGMRQERAGQDETGLSLVSEEMGVPF